MTKNYRYKNDNNWSEYYDLFEVLDMPLPDDTLIWWVGLCENNYPAETCTHSITFKKLKDDNKEMINEIKNKNQRREISNL